MANNKSSLSVKERLRRAKASGTTLLPTRTVDVWLGADVDILDAYAEAVAAATTTDEPAGAGRGRRLDGRGSRAEAQQRADSLAEQLAEFRVAWKVRGLSEREWERLLAANAPRKDGDGVDAQDAAVGWNSQTMPKALVLTGTVEPKLDEQDWKDLLGDDDTDGQLPPGEIDKISAAVFNLTRKPISVPFSSPASKQNPSS